MYFIGKTHKHAHSARNNLRCRQVGHRAVHLPNSIHPNGSHCCAAGFAMTRFTSRFWYLPTVPILDFLRCLNSTLVWQTTHHVSHREISFETFYPWHVRGIQTFFALSFLELQVAPVDIFDDSRTVQMCQAFLAPKWRHTNSHTRAIIMPIKFTSISLFEVPLKMCNLHQ